MPVSVNIGNKLMQICSLILLRYGPAQSKFGICNPSLPQSLCTHSNSWSSWSLSYSIVSAPQYLPASGKPATSPRWVTHLLPLSGPVAAHWLPHGVVLLASSRLSLQQQASGKQWSAPRLLPLRLQYCQQRACRLLQQSCCGAPHSSSPPRNGSKQQPAAKRWWAQGSWSSLLEATAPTHDFCSGAPPPPYRSPGEQLHLFQ